MKNHRQLSFWDELLVDSFAGGGGASTGIELALGRSVDIAINHDKEALVMHEANHPLTRHYCEDVWQVDPREATQGKPVALAWFSPDCKHFSKAKGGQPREQRSRKLNKKMGTYLIEVIVDGTVKGYARYGSVSDVAYGRIEQTPDLFEIDCSDYKPCNCKTGTTCYFWTTYAGKYGLHWPGEVCLEHQTIIRGHLPYAVPCDCPEYLGVFCCEGWPRCGHPGQDTSDCICSHCRRKYSNVG